jgi:protease-4
MSGYSQFVGSDWSQKGRNLTTDAVRSFADGASFTGQQAFSVGTGRSSWAPKMPVAGQPNLLDSIEKPNPFTFGEKKTSLFSRLISNSLADHFTPFPDSRRVPIG